MSKYIKYWDEIKIQDVPVVGGKNASLGEMFSNLVKQGINIPYGFAVTANGYWEFLQVNNLTDALKKLLDSLDKVHFANLSNVGSQCRNLLLTAGFPPQLKEEIILAYRKLVSTYGEHISLAVRSSATAEDLPKASFAGLQETYLNIQGEKSLIESCQACFASLFTDRAIKYRTDNGFDHLKVALSIGVQIMVRADKASSGVIFTLDPDSGFENVILISSSYGLGENIVQGNVNPDEFLVFKPFLEKSVNPVISHKLGSKEKTMTYAKKKKDSFESGIVNTATTEALRKQFSISDQEIIKLSQWACLIEKHYGCHMDIEWAKDGITNELFIVQARPETIHSNKPKPNTYTSFTLKSTGKILAKGIGLGNRIASGKARVLTSAADIDKLQEGEILITTRTDPDWDPILKKVKAIVTDSGGRTSHAAIIARELGAIAVVGTGDATSAISNGQIVTVSAAEGDTGYIYEGKLEWEEKITDFSKLAKPTTKPMLILAHPDQAFKHSFLPNEGVGLLRMEFIISNAIGIHPMALCHVDKIEDNQTRKIIERRTDAFENKKDFFIHRLAESIAMIAAAFYPKEVIVRMSDFKSNEYANLLGGKQFEPHEENPMIGFRGASRYYHPLYHDGFVMECEAMKKVRDEMGFTNVKLMIPFCRTVEEIKKVSDIMADNRLVRGKNGLELYMMLEIPSNALLAEEFAKYVDGFSIGSNDLTQLTLGADRDSELLSDIFSPFDPAVINLIRLSITKAKKCGVKIGLCGQAPSDYPEYAQFLVDCGIDSISFNPDALVQGIENINLAENKKQEKTKHNKKHEESI